MIFDLKTDLKNRLYRDSTRNLAKMAEKQPGENSMRNLTRGILQMLKNAGLVGGLE